MKQKILLLLIATGFIVVADAQKKSEKQTAYAITSVEKGSSKWSEVKLVDMITGEEIQSVYESKSEIPVLNARTKKPVVIKDVTFQVKPVNNILTTHSGARIEVRELDNQPNVYITTEPESRISERKIIRCAKTIRSNAPFSTNSAACAYDKKHDRLYYTPMGINQLRYIDLKSATATIYYFEDEPLGVLSNPGDVQNQVTRMAMGSDGNGYALTNNSEHLIQFTTNKKAKITDLGALTDDPSNGKYSIHSQNGYGGDMVADNNKNLYVITGNRMVFKVDIKTLVATFKGKIRGLPAGYTTNGAVVEKGSTIIVTSSTNSSAYYKFNLDDLQAEKISTGSSVFNASDLANSNLISEKKKKKQEDAAAVEEKKPEVNESEAAKIINPASEEFASQRISVYPNPVSSGSFKISFEDYQPGNYELQLVDLNGKSIRSQAAIVNYKSQVLEFRLPVSITKGTYLLKIVNSSNQAVGTEKIIVQ